MIAREIEILIHEVVDGTASEEQRRRLDAFLAESAEGRARMQELAAMFQTLERVPAVSPPPDLRARVLAALEARAPARSPSARGLTQKLAYVFAAGLVAGAVGMGAWTGVLSLKGPGGEPPVTGTMMPARPPSTGGVRRAWEAGGSRVEAVSWRAGGASLVGLQVVGDDPSEVELRFDPRLRAGGIRQSRPATGVVAIEPGRVLIRAATRGEFVVEFQDAPRGAPVQITLRSGSGSAGGELPLIAER